jgi:methylmalonyl-CoA mutase N-terminal domain/subunit
MWARIMRERFGAKDEHSKTMRFHTQTGGVTAGTTARGQHHPGGAAGLAAWRGDATLHANGFDEALALPTERSARSRFAPGWCRPRVGRRRQRRPVRGVLPDRVADRRDRDPRWERSTRSSNWGLVEALASSSDRGVRGLLPRAPSQRPDIIVGVNKYVIEQVDDVEILGSTRSPSGARSIAWASSGGCDQEALGRLQELRQVAEGEGNLLYPIKDALRAGASIGEVCGAMRDAFGEYKGGAFF